MQESSMKIISVKNASLFGRLSAFAFSVISLALICLTLSERNWMDGFSIFNVVVGCISILAVWVPP
jgi:hypothetical protein